MSRRKTDIEHRRLELQACLDTQKSQGERNRLGQFATPTTLAEQILRYAAELLPQERSVRFLDPAIGTGAFYSALQRVFGRKRITEALGFEIDRHYAAPAKELWNKHGLTIELADFTDVEAKARFNLVICNPPYVRHHHLKNDKKGRLQLRTRDVSGIRLSGLAGLYCYFLGLAHGWMAPDAVAGWLIPSEFMNVNYGRSLKQYLLERVTLLHIHRFDPNDVQFADALVSSAIVWLQNARPPTGHIIKFTFGGTLLEPRITKTVPAQALLHEPKWTRFPLAEVRHRSAVPTVADLFKIKRGLATGDNGYFILSEQEILARGLPMGAFRPILPSPRYLPADEIKSREDGTPEIEKRLFLLDTKLPEEEIRVRYPKLFAYLQDGRARGLHERYLCSHRPIWYAQENRPAPPIVCTYLGRSDKKDGRPFRFILNGSDATVANVYLAMYPTRALAEALKRDPGLLREVWKILRDLKPDELLGEGRVYGGGLHKLEPRELSNVPLARLGGMISSDRPQSQLDFLSDSAA